MKSVSSLTIIVLLFFACRLCNLTGSNNRAPSSPTPAALYYAADLIKPQLGQFKLNRSYTKEEARKTASGFAAKIIDQSTDAAGGEYKSSGGQFVALMVMAYSSTTTPGLLVDQIETDMRNAHAWKSVSAIPQHNGKKVEGVDGRGNGLVIWNNGYWLFMTVGNSLPDATSLADSVGY